MTTKSEQQLIAESIKDELEVHPSMKRDLNKEIVNLIAQHEDNADYHRRVKPTHVNYKSAAWHKKGEDYHQKAANLLRDYAQHTGSKHVNLEKV